VLRFTKGKQTLQVSHFIIFDFESILETVDIPSTSGKSSKVKKHKPVAFSYCIVNEDGKLLEEPFFYAGEDCVEVFFQRMFVEEKKIMQIKENACNKLLVTPELLKLKDEAEHCYLCYKPFDQGPSQPPLTKVLDHNHLLPEGENFRGVACSGCNIKYAISKSIPVIAHNARHYDWKLITSQIPLAEIRFQKRPFFICGKSSEELISFTIGNLEFKDSVQFAPESLSTLAELLADDEFKILRSVFSSEKQFRACRKKQFFPYNFLDSVQKLNTKLIPDHCEFFNDLTQKNISAEEYAELKQTLSELGLSENEHKFIDYLKTYVVLDVLILADVICNLRKSVWDNYRLEMLNFISNPGLSEAACFKQTDVELELLTDPEMYLWFKSSCRGGIVQSPVRFSQANNPAMGDRYNPAETRSWISMVDIVNLYGYTMTNYPHGCSNFNWMSAEEIEEFDISKYDEFGNTGYLLSTNWYIDPKRHDFFSTFCPFPLKMEITESMLSPYSRSLMDRYKQKLGKPERLVCSLKDQKHYLISATVAKFYVNELNLKLVKINAGISYTQSYWMAPYIEKNTLLRQNATSDFQKRYFKSLNNSLFGRTLMDTSRFRDFKLVTNPYEFQQLMNNPLFKNYTLIGENAAMVEMMRRTVMQNRPIYLGSSILDISKIHLYRFVYVTLMTSLEKIGLDYRHLSVNYTDTDSICFTVRDVHDIFTDIYMQFRDQLDTSDFPKDHILYSAANKKVPGKFTIETGPLIVDFIAVLASKAYSIKIFQHKKTLSNSSNSSSSSSSSNNVSSRDIMKVKSIPRKVIKKKLSPDDFKNALLNSVTNDSSNSGIVECEFFHFKSCKQQIYTHKTKRQSLYPNDIKAYILDDGITCLPYYHQNITKHN